MIKEIIRPDHCLRVCDECADERIVNYWGVKNREIHLCPKCSGKKAFEKKKDKYKPWNLGKTYQKCSGNYYINNGGYKSYYIGDKSYKGGYITEHRIVMELLLNRRLEKGEIVHHIDGNKLNNNESNLLLTDEKNHRILHGNLEKVSFMLVQSGVINFDSISKEYSIAPEYQELLKIHTYDEKYTSPLGNNKEECSKTIQKWCEGFNQ